MAGWGTGAYARERNLNRPKREGLTSRFRGVSRAVYREQTVWKATAYYSGKAHHLGFFPYTEEGEIEAAKAYDAKTKEFWGRNANLNFPEGL